MKVTVHISATYNSIEDLMMDVCKNHSNCKKCPLKNKQTNECKYGELKRAKETSPEYATFLEHSIFDDIEKFYHEKARSENTNPENKVKKYYIFIKYNT